MPHDRFFVDTPFHLHAQLDLDAEARHLKVMRIREGDSLELVNGRNQLAHARFLGGSRAEIREIEEKLPPQPTILCQAIPRQSRLDTIVEKGTELGMTELWLFPGERSEKKNVPLERLQKITIAAMKQCGRLDLPKIVVKPFLSKWEELPCLAYFGDLSESAPSFLSLLQHEEGLCFFVGPEAGFTPAEEEKMKALGAQGVKLHPWILRTDTASMAALSTIASFRT